MDRQHIVLALTTLGRHLDEQGLKGDHLDPAARFFVEELFDAGQ